MMMCEGAAGPIVWRYAYSIHTVVFRR